MHILQNACWDYSATLGIYSDDTQNKYRGGRGNLHGAGGRLGASAPLRFLLAMLLALALFLQLGLTVADVSRCREEPSGRLAPCAPGNQECPPGPFGVATPQYHVRDASCGENDPNGPSFDPVHGVCKNPLFVSMRSLVTTLYLSHVFACCAAHGRSTDHLHYQNHVGLHGGRTYGHAVSRDLIHWAHMPISIWNDRPYDTTAIYTGSATVVGGKIVQVYPGLCDVEQPGCPGAVNLCMAVPADPSDPLQTNWSKTGETAGYLPSIDGYTNPIVNGSTRDPSTAWYNNQTKEWQLTTYDTTNYGSLDFRTWYKLGKQPGFPQGECPSFFELPPMTPGSAPPPADAQMPTHVHKNSHRGKDWVQVGTYKPGAAKTLGTFEATPGVPFAQSLVDAGAFCELSCHLLSGAGQSHASQPRSSIELSSSCLSVIR